MYGKVAQPYWDDRPVAVIGGGPSLHDFDFEQLRGAHVLAVKNAIVNIPWADAGFGLHMAWYREWREKLAVMRTRIYWAVSPDQLDPDELPTKNITLLRRLDGLGVARNPGEIFGGGTSGFGALQVCIHKRAREIVLFGFDYDGTYKNGGSTDKRRAQNVEHWAEWAEHFSAYVPYLSKHGIHVTNACPSSAIRCFQKVALRDGAAMVREKLAA
jgi:hypothetical protein